MHQFHDVFHLGNAIYSVRQTCVALVGVREWMKSEAQRSEYIHHRSQLHSININHDEQRLNHEDDWQTYIVSLDRVVLHIQFVQGNMPFHASKYPIVQTKARNDLQLLKDIDGLIMYKRQRKDNMVKCMICTSVLGAVKITG
jgi:hypothetical protein